MTDRREGWATRNRLPPLHCALAVIALLGGQAPGMASAQTPKAEPNPRQNQRDGSRDFHFEFGAWTTQLSRLLGPLTGSKTWVHYEGVTTVREIMGGRANVAELDVAGSAGRIEGLSLRLYNPDTRQWSLNFAAIRSGVLTSPVFGEFGSGRGMFFGQDTLNGRAILVRFVISDITPQSARFEQAFSDDGGRTWEVNWIAQDTRRR